MKAIYSGCILDPWVEVAEKLYKEEGIEPAYWIGWDKNNEEKIIKEKFPEIMFHGFSDAWRGIFPKETESFQAQALDSDLLKKNSFHELMTIRMMDRMDLDRQSFNFNQRQRLFRSLLKKWLAVIDEIKPDIIISPSIPHRVFDYVLYVAAKERGIKFITYRATYIKGLLLPVDDIYNLPEEVNDYSSLSYEKISEKIQNTLESLKKEYSIAKPDYIKEKENNANFYKIFSLAKGFFSHPKKYINFISKLFKSSKSCFKEKNKKIEESNFSFLDLEVIKFKGRKYKNKLKKYYQSLIINPNLKEKYILIALHYQPEATSTPSGDVFTDQFLMIDLISKSVPNDWKIYVKEHKNQFHPLSWGEMSREKCFYDDILKLKNVKLISSSYNTFELIDNSQAIATLTGTIGFESIVRGKPVLIFGSTWYSPLKSVFKIKNNQDMDLAMQKIKNNYFVDKDDIYKYLGYLEKNLGVYAYHYKNKKEKTGISKEFSIKSLIKSIKWIVSR